MTLSEYLANDVASTLWAYKVGVGLGAAVLSAIAIPIYRHFSNKYAEKRVDEVNERLRSEDEAVKEK